MACSLRNVDSVCLRFLVVFGGKSLLLSKESVCTCLSCCNGVEVCIGCVGFCTGCSGVCTGVTGVCTGCVCISTGVTGVCTGCVCIGTGVTSVCTGCTGTPSICNVCKQGKIV